MFVIASDSIRAIDITSGLERNMFHQTNRYFELKEWGWLAAVFRKNNIANSINNLFITVCASVPSVNTFNLCIFWSMQL